MRAAHKGADSGDKPLGSVVAAAGHLAAIYRLEWRHAWRHSDGTDRVHVRGLDIGPKDLVAAAHAVASEALDREFRISLLRGGSVVSRVHSHLAELGSCSGMADGLPRPRMPTRWADEDRRGAVRSGIYAEIVDALSRAAGQRIASRRDAREIMSRVRAAFGLR